MTIEDQLREIVREAITPLIDEIREIKAKVEREDETLSIEQAAKFLNIGRNKMLEFTHMPDFYPAKRLGNRVIISKNQLIQWRDNINMRKKYASKLRQI
ncbi:hypothetical protein GCM10011391_28460 [Pullulanibacillus camelliae]|uniref:DNA-binding protein n=1 Tax=Pullulanibacillus camelliae TaxID=1707096 RepID=A0A8J3DX84_9BACL|nr:hypothetical protein [Pullulanibacillus camelliae]GGE47981.1 hypothetical protein GCM10011391_28460 [Pullulanibacillus camelliae]